MSASLRATFATFGFTDALPLFEDATFHLDAGWTGLVGPNGAGKTTLLRLIAGELSPTSGSLTRDPRDAVVRLCPQRVDALDEAIRAFGADWSPDACRIRGRLHLDPDALARWETLSPGERKRWQVGAALVEAPDVLLLDEPTNHLDAEGRAWLVGALRRFAGPGLIVSHDRALLDALTTRTLRVDRGEVTLWPGGFSKAKALWEGRRAEELEAYQAAKAHKAKVEARLRQARVDQAGAHARRSTGRRMKGPKDSDARTLMADYKVEQAEKRIGRQVGALRQLAERAAEAVGQFEFEKEVGRSVFMDYAPCPRPQVLRLEAAEVRAGPHRVLGPITLTVGRHERIHLYGPNGAGKTTLLRALLEASALPPDRVLYVPQELTADEGAEVLARVRALPTDVRGRVLSLVAALGVNPDRLLASCAPSPGEARKLVIADGLGRHVWALVLDEPTNHLDLPSIERLEAALARWPGALLLVTHDEALARRVCRTRWALAGGAVDVSSY